MSDQSVILVNLLKVKPGMQDALIALPHPPRLENHPADRRKGRHRRQSNADRRRQPYVNSDEFEDRVKALRTRLHRYCARMTGSAVNGEDVLQDALVKALQARTQGVVVDNLDGGNRRARLSDISTAARTAALLAISSIE